jgi:hypothetical protein
MLFYAWRSRQQGLGLEWFRGRLKQEDRRPNWLEF